MSEPLKNMSPMVAGLFITAGVAFFVAAGLSRQVAFFGVGTAMMGVGVVFLAQSKQKDGDK